MSKTSAPPSKAPFRDILAYTTGDGVNSLILNSIFGFAMLFYTEALGLDPKLAGWAMALATFWDAITDPIMGYVSDNTRSRYGRRHPYMLVGGIFSAICFYFVWGVPETFHGSPQALFWYLVVINLLLRTGITVFAVSHHALGFQMCTEYNQRATLQGVKWGFNMLVNLAGPAMAWVVFFPDKGGVEPTTVVDNYLRMGGVFSIAALCLAVFVVFATRKYIIDTRDDLGASPTKRPSFTKDFKDILTDKHPRTVFVFIAVVLIGIVLVSALQMYVYVHFMKFSAAHKSIVHGSTMVACGLGGLLSSLIVRRLDKKPAVCMAVVISVFSNVMLLLIFLTGWLSPGTEYTLGGVTIPIAMLVFLVFHAAYWAGSGIMLPIANSMMADISEICKHRTGVLKDGGYSAMLSFITKTSMSIGLLLSGYCLDWAGIKSKTVDRVIAIVMEEAPTPATTSGPNPASNTSAPAATTRLTSASATTRQTASAPTICPQVTSAPADFGVTIATSAVRVNVAPTETLVSASYTVKEDAEIRPFWIRLGLDTSDPPDSTIDTFLTDSHDTSRPRDIEGDVTTGVHETNKLDLRGLLATLDQKVESNVQTPEAVRTLAFITFVSGTILALLAFFAIIRYPVTREFMERIKDELDKTSPPNPSADNSDNLRDK